jgi:hypothetical protein
MRRTPPELTRWLDGRSKHLQTCSDDLSLLFWEFSGGSPPCCVHWPSTCRDVEWHSQSCIIGWHVQVCALTSLTRSHCPSAMSFSRCLTAEQGQGAWEEGVDGGVVTALDRSLSHEMVAVADESGQVSLLSYPAVSSSAPRKSYCGHVAVVPALRFSADDNYIITAGGVDGCVLQWRVLRNDG